MFKNKKGDLMLNILTTIIMLIVFFNVAPVLDSLAKEMLGLNPDSLVIWMLRGVVYILLIGVLGYIIKINSSGGGME
jgi:hypothetical protein